MCAVIELASTKYQLVSTDLQTLLPNQVRNHGVRKVVGFLFELCISKVLELSLFICLIVHSGVSNFTVDFTEFPLILHWICKDLCLYLSLGHFADQLI